MKTFFFSSRRRHTRCGRDWSSDVCSSDLLWRRWRFQSATAISAIPMGMPGWPDFAASTASIASARIELASSPSDAGGFIGGRKLYSAHDAAPLQPPGGLRAPRFGAGALRRTLVRVPRHRPAGRDRAARSAPERRPAGAAAAVVGPAAVAEKPQLVGDAAA